jgi:hypothetical protein
MANMLSNIDILEHEAAGFDNKVEDVRRELQVGEANGRALWEAEQMQGEIILARGS